MGTPKITIEGEAKTGKSALAWAIKDALAQHGIHCRLTGCEDEAPDILAGTWKKRVLALQNKTVQLETKRTRAAAAA